MRSGLAQRRFCQVPVVDVLQRAHHAQAAVRPRLLHHLADAAHPAVTAVRTHAPGFLLEARAGLVQDAPAAARQRRLVLRVHQGREAAQKGFPVLCAVAQHLQALVGKVPQAFRQADVEDADARGPQGLSQGPQLGGGVLSGIRTGLG